MFCGIGADQAFYPVLNSVYMRITFITGNPDKAEQLSRYLAYPIAHRKLDVPELQSLDPVEVVKHKALAAYKQIQGPVLVEDTSLTFYALGKLPGTLIKWFLTELGTAGLCKILNSFADRSACAQVHFCLYDGKELRLFVGKVEGLIASEPRGDQDFGWGPIFIPNGCKKTWGEMSAEEQNATAMRRIALEKLDAYLKTTE